LFLQLNSFFKMFLKLYFLEKNIKLIFYIYIYIYIYFSIILILYFFKKMLMSYLPSLFLLLLARRALIVEWIEFSM